jgi:phosphoesterase RecJ-like protein
MALLDCHEPRRSGPRAEAFLTGSTKPLAIIDHHQGQAELGQAVWIDTGRAATAEMVAHMAFERGWQMNADAAACLFVGLQTDTGSFRYSNTSPRALDMAGRLVAAGADPWAASQEVYANTPCRLKMMGRVGSHLEILADGLLARSWVSQTDFTTTGCGPEDLEQVVEELRSIRGVQVSLLLRELPDGAVKISMRSRGEVDVAAVALELGGGGHHNAAGAVIPGPLEEASASLSKRLTRLLEQGS